MAYFVYILMSEKAGTYYNFSKPHRSLTLRSPNGKRIKRTPAMAANLIEHIWPIREILAYPMN